MSARLEQFSLNENIVLGAKVPQVEELNTVCDFGVNFYDPNLRWDDLNRGGGNAMIYIGENPMMYEVKGRRPILDDEGYLKGMEWNLATIKENNDDVQSELVVKGRKDPVLYRYGATQGDEVFLLEQEESPVINFPKPAEYLDPAAG